MEQKLVEAFLRYAEQPVNLYEYLQKYKKSLAGIDEDVEVYRNGIEENEMFWGCGAVWVKPGLKKRGFREIIETTQTKWKLQKAVRRMGKAGYWWVDSTRPIKEMYRKVE